MTRVYLSGPMTGIPNWNRPAFMEAAGRLRSCGFEVVNPAEVSIQRGTWADFMRHDIRMMLDVDCVVTLPGWKRSKGASLEVHIAEQLGIPVYAYEEFHVMPEQHIINKLNHCQQLALDLPVEESL